MVSVRQQNFKTRKIHSEHMQHYNIWSSLSPHHLIPPSSWNDSLATFSSEESGVSPLNGAHDWWLNKGNRTDIGASRIEQKPEEHG